MKVLCSEIFTLWPYGPDGLDSLSSSHAVSCQLLIRAKPLPSLGWEDLLEKEMATHSSFLAGKSHGQRDLGGLQSTGSQRVSHDLATKQQTTSPYLMNLYTSFISAWNTPAEWITPLSKP